MVDEREAPPGVDPTQPSTARLYDYYLGGDNNFPVDKAAGEKLRAALPDLYDAAWANRGFHQRAARWMAGEENIRQFIDIGSGLPTQGNTHMAVRRVRPDARVVYVDIDPMVHAMAAGLLTDEDHTKLIQGDLREPEAVLSDPGLRSLIDLSEPVGLLMTAVVHFVADGSEPAKLVKRYTDALAPGSYLALSHATADKLPERSVQAMYDTYENANALIYLRTRDEVGRLFDGLEMVEPYPDADELVTYVGLWGAESVEEADSDGSRVLYCGVGKRL
jgi:O-methyltransferase involved in polyketide biosynthesis